MPRVSGLGNASRFMVHLATRVICSSLEWGVGVSPRRWVLQFSFSLKVEGQLSLLAKPYMCQGRRVFMFGIFRSTF